MNPPCRLCPLLPCLGAIAWVVSLVPLIGQPVVINEIHYDPPNNARPSEFIELHNSGPIAVDLAGWRFSDAIDFTFPAGTQLAPGAFIVVTRDMAAFGADFPNRTALGPWSGTLRNGGERIRLRDAAGVVVDEVDYGAGFPWPTHAAGGGSSMELINPRLDNDLGGSWRSSPGPGLAAAPILLVAPGDTGWRFRRGTSEASDPMDGWRQGEFLEDDTWFTVRTPVGYNEPNLHTDLNAQPWNAPPMQLNYISAYFRKPFVLPGESVPAQLRLRVSVDDGCIVWINGQYAGRFNINGTDEKPYNAGVTEPAGIPPGATSHEAVTGAGAAVWQDIVIDSASVNLHPGLNILAIHAFNESIGSSDFSMDAQLLAEFPPRPTPGAANANLTINAPPQIRQVIHTPRQPKSAEPVIITARITDPDDVAEVKLDYQIVEPGAYIRKKDAAYLNEWTSIAMNDAGAEGDAVSGDSVFSATLAGTLQLHRRLIRYRITATDALGAAVLAPYPDDGSPNFAYFCYDGVPGWSGAFRPGAAGEAGSVQPFSESLMRERPAYHLLANQADVTTSQYTQGQDATRMQGTFVFEDQVLDHITFHNRGEFSTYVSGKNKWRFHFNRTRELLPRDDYGRPYQESWGDLNLNGGSSPWIAANRGMAGVEERLSFRMYELAGVPAPKTHYISLRVIDNAVEAADPLANNHADPSLGSGRAYYGQYSGDFWGQYIAIESPDGSFLDERGLPDGNVYKIENGGTGTGDKKHQAYGQPTTAADWTAFASGSARAQPESWWRENLDLPAYYSFRAVSRIVGNVDMRDGWNHYFYHAPVGGWKPIPWDLDMMFVGRRHQSASGAITQDRCVTLPALDIEKRNRCRELLDLLVSDSTPAGGQVGQLIDELAQNVNPTGQPLTWADIDAAMWNFHPRTMGSPATPPATASDSAHRGNFYYTRFTFNAFGGAYTRWLRTPDFRGTAEHEDFMKYLLDYMTDTYPGPAAWAVNNGNQLGYGHEFLQLEAADSAIPARPTITYVGDAGHPVHALRFESSPFSDPQGDQSFAAIQWRLGEIAAPGVPGYEPGTPRVYEVEESWTSEEITPFATSITLPAQAARPGRTYRARVRHMDATTRWSRWSEPVQFVAGAPDISHFINSLVISEIMYHPAPPTPEEAALGFTEDDFEFIELMNVSGETIDLTGVRFTKGVDADFAPGTRIGPGGFLLVVRNQPAFEKRYGTGHPIGGSFPTDQLRNSGEEVKLSFGAGVEIRSLVYLDSAPWPVAADGDGPSLQLISPESRPDHSKPENWRASPAPFGSPGTAELVDVTFASWTAALGLPADPDVDSDGDSATNKLEYGLATDPTAPHSVPQLTARVEAVEVAGVTAEYPVITFVRRSDASDAICLVEFSPPHGPWSAGGTLIRSEPAGPGTTRETWRAPLPITIQAAGFARVRVQ